MSADKPVFWPKACLLICIKYLGSLLEMQEHKAEWETPMCCIALGILLLSCWHWRTRQETTLSPLGEVTFWVLEQPSWALVKAFQERRGRDRGGEARWCRFTLTESMPNPYNRAVQATKEHSRWVSMDSDTTTKHPDQRYCPSTSSWLTLTLFPRK